MVISMASLLTNKGEHTSTKMYTLNLKNNNDIVIISYKFPAHAHMVEQEECNEELGVRQVRRHNWKSLVVVLFLYIYIKYEGTI